VGADLKPCIADICDETRVSDLFAAERPDVVFHCAAHKHVPMMEANPGEAVKNNVLGTRRVADASLRAGCSAFVLVSSDKAVNPASVMGATKRCSEIYVQSLAHRSVTRFVAVRFGNVLGSSGSVVPIFRRQIEAGGPITVTHPDMKRYFMTIPEASQLVMQAGAIGQGGEIFVLDMGEPIRILDLAREMIARAGLRPEEDIAIKFTGIRPGEKLHEQLASDNERTRPTSHGKIRVWQLTAASEEQVDKMLTILSEVVNADRADVIRALKQCVPEYQAGLNAAEEDRPAMRLVGVEAA
jgi:FlaA1/EpsC-like NDP-sugar epimerase